MFLFIFYALTNTEGNISSYPVAIFGGSATHMTSFKKETFSIFYPGSTALKFVKIYTTDLEGVEKYAASMTVKKEPIEKYMSYIQEYQIATA